MYLVLKPNIKLIWNDGILSLQDLFEDFQPIEVSLKKTKMNKGLFEMLLLNGFTVTQFPVFEEKIALKMYRDYQNFFIVSESNSNSILHKVKTLREMIHEAIPKGTPVEFLKEYMGRWDSQQIVIIDDHTDSCKTLLKKLKEVGLTGSAIVSLEELNSNDMAGDEILLVPYVIFQVPELENKLKHIFETNSFLTYLPYGVMEDCIHIGPIIKKGITACFWCSSMRDLIQGTINFHHGYPKHVEGFIHSFLLHTLYFIVGELHKEIYYDVGLPLKKVLQIDIHSLKGKAEPIYKQLECERCHGKVFV